MYNRIGEAEDYDSNFGDTQESNDRYKNNNNKNHRKYSNVGN